MPEEAPVTRTLAGVCMVPKLARAEWEVAHKKVLPVELDGSRPKEMPGMRPRGQICKRGIC